jgi:hypothetical protein
VIQSTIIILIEFAEGSRRVGDFFLGEFTVTVGVEGL